MLNVRLLGKFRVESGSLPIDGLDGIKSRELLAYLLLYRDRPHSREVLASLLWADYTTAQAKKYLRQALWQLQAAVDRASGAASPLVLADGEWIQLNPAAEVWLDVDEMKHVFARVQRLREDQLDRDEVEALRHAAQLYGGDLLDGWYEDWCIYERERLQNIYLTMLDKLIGYCEAHQEYSPGLDYAAVILRIDPAHERTHRCVMRMYYLNGDRTRALRQYHRCVAALAQHLDVAPSRLTQQLYEQIKADQGVDAATMITDAAPNTQHAVDPALSARDNLREVQAALIDAERRIQQGRRALDQLFGALP